MPATSFTTAIFDSASEPPQRSSASESARRTRLSSNGFFCWFSATWIEQFQALSCTVILLPSALHELIALHRREAAELDHGALAADGRHLRGVVTDEERAVAVEVRLALVPVVRVLLADPVRAAHVLDELEGAGAHHVLLVPVRILGEDLGLVDPVPRRREARDERRLPDTSAGTPRWSSLGASTASTALYCACRLDTTPAGGKMILSYDALTSCAVSALPSWNFTPWRILNV